jgi:GNAT superfamily N-acetyltransferase
MPLFAVSSLWRNDALQILREYQGLNQVFLLKTYELDEVLGEAVFSESENEIRLHEIFVKPEHRGKGYGEALIKAVLSYGEAKLVTLCTGLGNIPFFERYGFEVKYVGDSLISMERRP